jgi:hypothetical protein
MWVDFKHLRKANIGYIPHALRVSVVSLKLILIGVAGIIHAFLPVIFIETVSKGVKNCTMKLATFN